MYKRSIKPLKEFVNSNPSAGCYYVDTQFGTLSYQYEISGAIHTRISAGGAFFLIEVMDDEQESHKTDD
jgi:hypothetical protein